MPTAVTLTTPNRFCMPMLRDASRMKVRSRRPGMKQGLGKVGAEGR
jgi:hypothetical protein